MLRVWVQLTLAMFGVIYLVPAAIILFSAFRTPADVAQNGLIAFPGSFSIEPWITSWNDACVSGMCEGISSNFFNSLKITIPATLFATLFGALNGYVLSKWRFPGADFVYGTIVFGVFLPPQVTLLPWAYIIGRLDLYNSVYGLILVHSIAGLSFTTLFCRNFYAAIPDDLIRAARVDGAGFWRIFVRIVLPLSPPILIVSVIWQFTSIWNEYLFGVVFSSGRDQPITAALQSVGVGGSSATVLIAALPPLLIYLLGGRYFVRGLTQGAIR